MLLLGAVLPAVAQQADTTAAGDTTIVVTQLPADTSKPKMTDHQLRLGIDMSRFLANALQADKQSYEVALDYHFRTKVYLVAEAGAGWGKVDFDYLKYNSNTVFARLGIEQSLLDLQSEKDFDMAFVGLRYGAGFGQRTEASYIVGSPFGGSANGTIPAQSFFVHWGELVAGLKLEVLPRTFLGWTLRAKFLLNSGTFKELAPSYIAGYGPGDKSTNFDINFYLSYALFR